MYGVEWFIIQISAYVLCNCVGVLLGTILAYDCSIGGYLRCWGMDMGMGMGIQHFLKNLGYNVSRIHVLITY